MSLLTRACPNYFDITFYIYGEELCSRGYGLSHNFWWVFLRNLKGLKNYKEYDYSYFTPGQNPPFFTQPFPLMYNNILLMSWLHMDTIIYFLSWHKDYKMNLQVVKSCHKFGPQYFRKFHVYSRLILSVWHNGQLPKSPKGLIRSHQNKVTLFRATVWHSVK